VIDKLYFEIRKNLKLIVRNWAAVLVVFLSPLLLLFLVGYSLSGSSVHDITIGLVTSDPLITVELSLALQEVASVNEFSSIDECTTAMQKEIVALCLQVKGEFRSNQKIPGAEVTFYYDNTRPKLTILLINEVKNQLGFASEQISLASAEEVLNNIHDLLGFLNARISDMGTVEDQIVQIETDLQERENTLHQLNQTFSPRYEHIKTIHNSLSLVKNRINSSQEQLEDSLTSLEKSLRVLETQLGKARGDEILENSFLERMIKGVRGDIAIVQSDLSGNRNRTYSIFTSLDSLIAELDLFDETLQAEIQRTAKYKALIEKSKYEVQIVLADAQEKISALSPDDPELAQKIIRPIAQFFRPLVPELKGIQITFPLLIGTLLIFMSLIVGNTMTLLEINNPARVRNILAPVSNSLFDIGIICTSLLILFFQFIIFSIMAHIYFSLPVFHVFFYILPLIILLCLVFIMIGMIIAYLTPTAESSILLSTVFSLAIFLFSGALQTIEQMPQIAYHLAQYNPLVIIERALRKIFFFENKLVHVFPEILTFLIYVILIYLTLWFVARKNSKLG
jgi:ABC-type polysaccharide/polyol phosphate export permease